jgi:hypothetical protein
VQVDELRVFDAAQRGEEAFNLIRRLGDGSAQGFTVSDEQ